MASQKLHYKFFWNFIFARNIFSSHLGQFRLGFFAGSFSLPVTERIVFRWPRRRIDLTLRRDILMMSFSCFFFIFFEGNFKEKNIFGTCFSLQVVHCYLMIIFVHFSFLPSFSPSYSFSLSVILPLLNPFFYL